MARPLRLGTRGSRLALAQTELVRQRLAAVGCGCELVIIKAEADQRPDAPLVAISGEGIFVKELEAALTAGRIDAAVHSLKDLPTTLGRGLTLGAVLPREDPRDALVARDVKTFEALPQRARVATSSPRRRSQLLHRRPDVQFVEIRGNVDTRLRKLREEGLDALIVAYCGLKRLGLADQVTQVLPTELMLPEPGQGALAVEIRADDAATRKLVSPLNDSATQACIEAERSLLLALGGGCRVPIAALGTITDNKLSLEGGVWSADGQHLVRMKISGSVNQPKELGQHLASQLRQAGADRLLK
ncbi:MAG: hydroxymethylbilane synthase [Candidatus Omnitrophica bacterium]|nr:hydroxymethylbilane synthase [Candidatus Omnitrophota bacterium]